MDCEAVRERLPWLLNSTLDAAEAAAVENHLAGCPACREERAGSELAARLFASHPTAADLVAHAFGDSPPAESELVASHLLACAECREELALVSASREAMDPAPVEQVGRAGGRANRDRRLALAATLAALLAGAGWLATWQALRDAGETAGQRQAALQERVERLEAALRPPPPAVAPSVPGTPPAAERLAALERELAELRAPRAGLAVVELLSDELVLRGPGAAPPAIEATRPTTLLLVADSFAAGESFRLRLLPAAGGAAAWEGEARAPTAGELALYLPAGALPPGSYQLQVRRASDAAVLATFRLDAR
jgi:hypothetical protein